MDSLYHGFLRCSDSTWLKGEMAKHPKEAHEYIADVIPKLAYKTLREKHLPEVTPEEEERFFDSIKDAPFRATNELLWTAILLKNEKMALRLLDCAAPITPVAAYLASVGKLPNLLERMIKTDRVVAQVFAHSHFKVSNLSFPESEGHLFSAMVHFGQEENLRVFIRGLFDLPQEYLAYLMPELLWDWVNQVGTLDMGAKLLDCFAEWPVREFSDTEVSHFKPKFAELLWEGRSWRFTYSQVLDIFLRSEAPSRDMAEFLLEEMTIGPGSSDRIKELLGCLVKLGWLDEIRKLYENASQEEEKLSEEEPTIELHVAEAIPIAMAHSDQATVDCLFALPATEEQKEVLFEELLGVLPSQIGQGNLTLCKQVFERAQFHPYLRPLHDIPCLMEEALTHGQSAIFDYFRKKFPDLVTEGTLLCAIEFGSIEVFKSLFNQILRMQGPWNLTNCLKKTFNIAVKSRKSQQLQKQQILLRAVLKAEANRGHAFFHICSYLIANFKDVPEEPLLRLFKWCCDALPKETIIFELNEQGQTLLEFAKENGRPVIAAYLENFQETYHKDLKETLDHLLVGYPGLKRAPQELKDQPAAKKARKE